MITLPEEIRVKAKLAVGDKYYGNTTRFAMKLLQCPNQNHFPKSFGDLEKIHGPTNPAMPIFARSGNTGERLFPSSCRKIALNTNIFICVL